MKLVDGRTRCSWPFSFPGRTCASTNKALLIDEPKMCSTRLMPSSTDPLDSPATFRRGRELKPCFRCNAYPHQNNAVNLGLECTEPVGREDFSGRIEGPIVTEGLCAIQLAIVKRRVVEFISDTQLKYCSTLATRILRMQIAKHLRQTLLRESNVDATELQQATLAALLVVADRLAERLDLRRGGDRGDEHLERLLKGGCIVDGEEEEVLVALGEAQPAQVLSVRVWWIIQLVLTRHRLEHPCISTIDNSEDIKA